MPLNEHWLSFEVENQRLHGMLHLPQAGNQPHPCVLLLHGFTGNALESHRLFILMARQLAENGIAAFRFDFRGSGNSEGVFEEMTPSREVEDARAALRLLETRPDVLARNRFGILGLSMGGMIAALTAGLESVKALCLWAPAAPKIMLWHDKGLDNPASIRAAYAAGFAGAIFPPGVRFNAERGVLDFGGNPVSSAFFEDTCTLKPIESIKNHKGASLVVHGDADPTVPWQIGQEYAHALNTKLHIIQGGLHTFETLPHQAEAHAVTLEFFKQAL
ncbi:MAG: alpha/beta hydrolase [Deinococcales bacterium]